MTAQQLDAAKRLAEQFNRSLANTEVLHEPFDLPSGWVRVAVYPARGDRPIIVAGIAPDGRTHT